MSLDLVAAPLLSTLHTLCADPGLSAERIMQETVSLLKANCPRYHWVGIYLLEGQELILGPYVGKHTDHTRIPVGTGVCGTAVAENKNQIVADVRTLSNYLACSLETRAEIVVLIRHPEDPTRILGQIDIDSDLPDAFTPADEHFLEQVAACLARKLARSA